MRREILQFAKNQKVGEIDDSTQQRHFAILILGGSQGAHSINMALLDAIDKIKDTASSHNRAFLIETMGRNSGYLALVSSIAGGAELVLIPEVETTFEEICRRVEDAYIRGKAHCIIVVAEGYKPGTQAIVEYLRARQDELGFGVRVTVLGHVQRGGSPTAFDRLLATRLGCAAVHELHEGNGGVIVGLVGNEIAVTPLEKVVGEKKTLDLSFYEMAKVLEK